MTEFGRSPSLSARWLESLVLHRDLPGLGGRVAALQARSFYADLLRARGAGGLARPMLTREDLYGRRLRRYAELDRGLARDGDPTSED